MSYKIPPAKAPTGYRSDAEWRDISQECTNLEVAKELIGDLLCADLTSLPHEGLLKLRSMWAYLHECHCASGKRPTRMPIFMGGDNWDRSNGDMAVQIPRTRSWVTNRKPVTA